MRMSILLYDGFTTLDIVGGVVPLPVDRIAMHLCTASAG